jgi:hypothetical protein
VTVRVVDQPNKVTVTEEVVTVQVASVGVQGPPGGPGVEISPTEPTNTDILWADTTEPGDQVIPPGGWHRGCAGEGVIERLRLRVGDA